MEYKESGQKANYPQKKNTWFLYKKWSSLFCSQSLRHMSLLSALSTLYLSALLSWFYCNVTTSFMSLSPLLNCKLLQNRDLMQPISVPLMPSIGLDTQCALRNGNYYYCDYCPSLTTRSLHKLYSFVLLIETFVPLRRETPISESQEYITYHWSQHMPLLSAPLQWWFLLVYMDDSELSFPLFCGDFQCKTISQEQKCLKR